MFIVSRLFQPLYNVVDSAGMSVVEHPETVRTIPDLNLQDLMTRETYAVCEHL